VHNVDVFAHENFLPTLAAAAGNPDIVAQCAKGCQSGNKSFKVHLDTEIEPMKMARDTATLVASGVSALAIPGSRSLILFASAALALASSRPDSATPTRQQPEEDL
jgi:hypothetical protein